jgi:hypothetical protein
MAEVIMPDFLISLAICILPFLVSSLVSIDYTNNKHNSKTKVLATLGSGNIQIADINQSNSKSCSKDSN